MRVAAASGKLANDDSSAGLKSHCGVLTRGLYFVFMDVKVNVVLAPAVSCLKPHVAFQR